MFNWQCFLKQTLNYVPGLGSKMNVKQPAFIGKDSQGEKIVRVDMVGVGGARLKENRSDSGLAVARVKARNHIGRDGLKILGILACREHIFWMERANGPLLTGSHHYGMLPASQNIDFLAFHCL